MVFLYGLFGKLMLVADISTSTRRNSTMTSGQLEQCVWAQKPQTRSKKTKLKRQNKTNILNYDKFLKAKAATIEEKTDNKFKEANYFVCWTTNNVKQLMAQIRYDKYKNTRRSTQCLAANESDFVISFTLPNRTRTAKQRKENWAEHTVK